jgi:transcriptional regulator with XRE-family HTH domain
LSRHFGLVLRDGRVARGLSQTTLAAKSGVDRSYLGHIEAGAHSPTLTVIFRLARVLRVPPSAMIGALETVVGDKKSHSPGVATRRKRPAKRR